MRYITYGVCLAAAVSGCSPDAEVTQPGAQLAQVASPPQYHVQILEPFAPGLSQGAGISNDGWVSGFTGMPDGTRQAAVWRRGQVTPLGVLGTLGGLHSMAQWPGINNTGMIVGISRTDTAETRGELWSCGAFMGGAGKTCLGFFWENGVMTSLPSLGGPNGFAAGINARGQAVGWAENLIEDPTCVAPQVLQFRAVLWEPRKGTKQELPPYPGDSTSAATAINARGQVVGISGDCDVAVGRKSARHAVLWENGVPTRIGDLGGDFWHTPMAINARGDVVGFSNPPGGDLDGNDFEAFSWTRHGGTTPLGKLDGDGSSQALGINADGVVVGVSCGAVCNGLVWHKGVRYKLKDLVVGDFPHHIWSARGINDAGQITGRLIESGTDRRVPFIATPILP